MNTDLNGFKQIKNLKHQEITKKVIKAFYTVYNTLGYGFLEKVYKNALVIELKLLTLQVIVEKSLQVKYRSHYVGDYFADLVIEDEVIVEIKACEVLCEAHDAQLLNYLMASDYEIGLLLNFGPGPRFKRKILTNDRKKIRNPWRSVASV
jgi:GxxExxY protein